MMKTNQMLNNYRIILFLFVVVSFAVACNKTDTDPFLGTGSAMKNDKAWKVQVSALKSLKAGEDTISISFELPNKENTYTTESLAFYNIPVIRKTNYIDSVSTTSFGSTTPVCWFLYWLSDGDVAGNRFFVSRNLPSNSLTIDEIDGDNIKGRFNVVLQRDVSQPKYTATVPDSLTFTDGWFDVK